MVNMCKRDMKFCGKHMKMNAIDVHPTIHAYEPFKRKTVKKYVQLRI